MTLKFFATDMLKTISMISLLLCPLLSYSNPTYDYGAQFRARNHHREFYHASGDKRNITELRVRLNGKIQLSDTLKIYFAPQATKNFGEKIAQSNDESSKSVLSSGDKYHSSIDIFEAYVESKEKYFTYKLGRQKLNYGDNIILGTRNWTNGGLTFDAIKFSIPVLSSSLDVAYSHISEGDSITTTQDDINLFLVYLKAIQDENMTLDIYGLNHNENNTAESQSYGFRFKYTVNDFDLRTENIYQVQKLDNEFNLNAEIGYTFNQEMKMRAFLGYAQASEYYDQLYTNRHKYNGIIDILGRQNLNTINVGLSLFPIEDLKVHLEYLNFSRNKKTNFAYNQSTSSTLAGNINKKDLGQEIDLLVSYKKSEFEKIVIGYSHFIYGDYFQDIDNANFAYLEYSVQF